MNAIMPVAMPMQDMQTLAVAIAKSNLFGIKTPGAGAGPDGDRPGRRPSPGRGREGLRYHQRQASQEGRGDAARFHPGWRQGGVARLTDELADATFTHPQTGEVRIDWDMKRARRPSARRTCTPNSPARCCAAASCQRASARSGRWPRRGCMCRRSRPTSPQGRAQRPDDRARRERRAQCHQRRGAAEGCRSADAARSQGGRACPGI